MATSSTAAPEYGVEPLRLNVSRDFCAFIAGFKAEDLPDAVVHESRRGVLDWIGCALAGSRHPTIPKLLAGIKALGSAGRASVIAHDLKLGHIEAAIANGQMGHVLDYDDTHMDGVVLHTSSPVLAALLSVAESGSFSGLDLVAAYAAGFEAGVRVGKASPGHHDGGWHLTGTLGTIAAGVAVGRMLGLDAARLTYALGIAATQAAGMQQNRGTMCKSFHAGKAASNGVLAGFLAREGVDSSDEIIEGKRGFSRIVQQRLEAGSLARRARPRLADPAQRLQALCLRRRAASAHRRHDRAAPPRRHRPGADRAGRDRASTRPPSASPASPSRRRGCNRNSASIIRRPWPSSTAMPALPNTATRGRLRRRWSRFAARCACRSTRASAGTRRMSPSSTAGGRHEAHVEHASGTVDNPMSDAALEDKFLANAEMAVGGARAREIAETVWRLERLPDVRELLRLCA